MPKLFEAMADIKLTTENIQKVIKMFPRDNDWKKLITKNRRDIDALRRGKDLPKKVEDELFNWALDNGEIKTDDVEELEDFIDRIMNEGTFKKRVIESVELDEGKMKEFHDMVKKGMTAEQISKKIGIDVKAIKDFMKDMD